MKDLRYSIIGVINGQEFKSKNNTKEEFKKLWDMIIVFGGWVVEYTEYALGEFQR